MAQEGSSNVKLSLSPFPHMLQTCLQWGFTDHTLLTRTNGKFSCLYLLGSLYFSGQARPFDLEVFFSPWSLSSSLR